MRDTARRRAVQWHAVADSTVTFLILGAVVVLFVSNAVPVAVVALAVPLALWATGILELDAALAGFGDPAVIFIASLFVVSEALDATGVTAWAGQQLIQRAGTSRARIIVLMMVLCAAVTALISVNGAVAALLPVVVVMAVKLRMPSSQLLMPLAFAAHAGSMLTLTGTPVSVIVSEAAEDAGVGRFGFFEFSLAGIPLLAGTILIVVLLGPRLLPHRSARQMPADFSELAYTLSRQYGLEPDADPLFSRQTGVAEIVVAPRSALVGETVFPGMVTESGNFVILAVQRRGQDLAPREVELAVGDTLLVQGSWHALANVLPTDPDVLLVAQPDLVRRQVVPLGTGARAALVVLAGMVVLLATGAVPAAVAGLLAAIALVVVRVVSLEQAYRSINWTTVILVAGMTPLSAAMQVTGAADTLANGLVEVVGESGPVPLLIGLFLLTAVLGQLISNMATALIVIPIALSAAAELDVAVSPVLMSLNIACAAALLTPIATPANLMVMEPGGYRFGDYWRLGAVIMAWYFVVAVVYVPLIWSF
jgi:di/tricarboxylate transporter